MVTHWVTPSSDLEINTFYSKLQFHKRDIPPAPGRPIMCTLNYKENHYWVKLSSKTGEVKFISTDSSNSASINKLYSQTGRNLKKNNSQNTPEYILKIF